MSRSTSHPVPTAPDSGGDLVRLLQAEQLLATRLDVTRIECQTIVARAREEAARGEAHLEADVAREREALTRELGEETAARIAALEANARNQAGRFAAASEADVDALTVEVLRWLGQPDGGGG